MQIALIRSFFKRRGTRSQRGEVQSFSEFFSLLIGFTNALMFSMNVRVFIKKVKTFLANALIVSMNVRGELPK